MYTMQDLEAASYIANRVIMHCTLHSSISIAKMVLMESEVNRRLIVN